MTFEFTIHNASFVEGWSVFHIKRKYFCFQNVLGYSWRCKFYNSTGRLARIENKYNLLLLKTL
jgi:hypothetical protein